MSILPVPLWSDICLWGLALSAALLGVRSRRSAAFTRAWHRLAHDKIGLAAATILTVFLAVGLLDSLHYRERLPEAGDGEVARYGVEVHSALDFLLTHLREQHEKTYSAPFATRLYAMENAEEANGPARIHPRLKHGGSHLADEAGRTADVFRQALPGAGLALCLLLLFHWRSRSFSLPVRVCGHTLLLLLLVFLPLFWLSFDYHVFGTDKVGQDVFYQALKSIRTALTIGLVTTLVMLPLAVFLGLAAGFFRGWADDVIQYLYTVLNSIPGVLLIAAAVLMMQVLIDTHPHWFSTAAERADLRLLALCAILGMTSWTGLARLLRGETLKLRELEYIEAARAFGVSPAKIVVRHVLPNLMHIIVITLAMDFSALVLTEAVLSYVGIGVDPAMTSFGTMINNARMELSREPAVWWSLLAAFSFMFTLVLAANLFADAIRDAFDPRRA